MHVRRKVRNGFTSLISGLPEFTNTTFESRVNDLSKVELPAAVVYTDGEMIERATRQHSQPALQRRIIETDIYVFARSQKEIENTLDDLAKKVEDQIFTDPTLGGVAVETLLSDVKMLISEDANSNVGAVRMTYRSMVLTKEGNSEVSIRL